MLDKSLLMSAQLTNSFPGPAEAGAAALATIRKAMDVRHADAQTVGRPLVGAVLLDDEMMSMTGSGFVFRCPGGARFRYELGKQLMAFIPDGGADEARLFQWGSVFGAVAWLNDLLPLHASAVADNDRVIAFTGQSGAGKSTLAAALVDDGMRHVCDDTLILAPSCEGLLAIPDNKPIKLWDDAFALVNARRAEAVASVPGKHYASVAQMCAEPLPLTDLIYLEAGEGASLTAITGGDKLNQFPQAMYRNSLHLARDDPDHHAQLMVMAASTVRSWRLVRPIDPVSFDETTTEIANLLRSHTKA